MIDWLKRMFSTKSHAHLQQSFNYLEAFSHLCEKLEHAGISSNKFSVFNMARYQFGQFHDSLENDNMKGALEHLSKFNHSLEALVQDVKSHGQMTQEIASLLQELKILSANIVKDFINQPEP